MPKKDNPRTHSDILWHFTGGAKWNSKKNVQGEKLKPLKESYKIALDILISKELWLGGYHELIKVVVPEYRYYDRKAKERKILKNHLVELRTSQVCCVADIPEDGLFHHAKRYGKMGIGFKRDSLIKAGFNPVFYTLQSEEIARNFFSAQHGLKGLEAYEVEYEVEQLVNDIELDLCERCAEDIYVDGSSIVDTAEAQIWAAQASEENLQRIMSFVKTFDSTEFDSIYAEREWRSLSQFNFRMSDIAALIFPNQKFADDFERNWAARLKIPKRVKVSVFD